MKVVIRILIGALLALGINGMSAAHPTFAAATVSGCPTSESALQTDITNAGAGGTVTFNCSTATTITFGSTITISNTVTLDGSTSRGRVTLDGGGATQMFVVNSGVTVYLTALTLSSGHAFTYDGTYSGDCGGAIFNYGAVTVTNSTFSGNHADSGGAVCSSGTVTVFNSTFSGQRSDQFGGAIGNDVNGTVTITTSTFSGNSAGSYGGAIFNEGNMTVLNSTFSTNLSASGTSGGGDYGGAILNNNNATLQLGGTVISSSPGGACFQIGAITDLGYNIVPDGNCPSGGTGDIQSASPGLDPNGLRNNGGPTQTIALQSGSPAIDQIPTSYTIPCLTCTKLHPGAPLCPATDQRGAGYPRPDNSETTCDIGAYEHQDTGGTTLAHIASGTVHRAGRQITVQWQMRTSAGVVGFRVYGGTRPLNRSLIPVHASSRYRFTVRYQGTGPFRLGVVLVSGQEVRVALR